VYTSIIKYILYPIGEKIIGTTMLRYLKELEESQWWSQNELRDLQDKKLRALVKHAYDNVPYYHRIFTERALSDKDIQSIEDLKKLPILTKNDIRNNFDQLTASNYKKYRPLLNATSGSTGEPLRYYITMDTISINWAGTFRGWRWAGYKLGDKRVTFGGFSLIPSKSPSLRNHLRWSIERTFPLSAVSLNIEKMALYAKKLRKYKPRFIYGYPSSICVFADYLKELGTNYIHPIAIFTTAEVLLPHYRQRIEDSFNCRVIDCYGCYDGGPQAIECMANNDYHITAEKSVIEVVDEDGILVPPGVSGEVLTTDLHNYAMPFIRYAVGDRGALSEEECSCGRGLPLMKSIQGRTTDQITFSNGVKISGPALTLAFKNCRIKQYQVVQEEKDKLIIKLVRIAGYSDKDSEHFLSILRAHAGISIDIEIKFVDQIKTTQAGKHRIVISKILK